MSTTTENASLTLAEEYVREQLTAETHGQTIGYGEEIDVPKMEQCDCVPIRVSTEGRSGSWTLAAVISPRYGTLTATYRWSTGA